MVDCCVCQLFNVNATNGDLWFYAHFSFLLGAVGGWQMVIHVSILKLVLVFLFPVALFTRREISIAKGALIISGGKRKRRILPCAGVLMLRTKSSALMGKIVDSTNKGFHLDFRTGGRSPCLLGISCVNVGPRFHTLGANGAGVRIKGVILARNLRLSRIIIATPVGRIRLINSAAIVGTSTCQVPRNSGLRRLMGGVPNLRCSERGGALICGKLPVTRVGIGKRTFFTKGRTLTLRGLPTSLMDEVGICSGHDRVRGFVKVGAKRRGCILSLRAGGRFGNALVASMTTNGNGGGGGRTRLVDGFFGANKRGLSMVTGDNGHGVASTGGSGHRSGMTIGFLGGFKGGVRLGKGIVCDGTVGKGRKASCCRRCLGAKGHCHCTADSHRGAGHVTDAVLDVG